ncbi:stationary-phase survival protein SurE [Denitrovibrio acetiphilus DSM 12809]|uniref:5'-nucleotidase SurE n=1 Tax=Denitrovibrio acetiphilus (strain DSM 12809 / NBRC 114555 / N2460) TaxID=522772 RepID=D4H772_DENA2|nr:5'/3'-nucleotidase SurE [Denitrovibrio acetiphilus]ADD67871.1 stationary-phase survival protein SurE [Denitrovibrio acetiphilus DSM 12809]
MRILLANDDGIYSEGIYALYKKLTEIADVTVVAPITEQSAVGHAITVADPLRVVDFYKFGEFFGYGIKGSPADCVKIAISDIMDRKPDLVVSGINHGANLATNVIYSGTVSAATEGAMMGVRSVAVSLATKEKYDFTTSAEIGAYFAKYMYSSSLPDNAVLNINVPALSKERIKGWRFARQGNSKYLDTFAKRTDPRGGSYYWLTGEKVEIDVTPESDEYMVENGYVSVTPLMFDMTDYRMYDQLKDTEGKGEFS